jgi:hypothetical protein
MQVQKFTANPSVTNFQNITKFLFLHEKKIRISACFSIREQKVNDNLTLYFVNNPQGKDGYRHKQMDDNFAELVKQIKPDIAHIRTR